MSTPPSETKQSLLSTLRPFLPIAGIHMPIVESTAVIDAPLASVFEISQDYYVRLKWDPFLSEIEFLHGATQPAVGVQVWVKAKNRLEMTVEYLAVQPPSHVAVKMIHGPFFPRSFGGAWRFHSDQPDHTQVLFRYSFRTRWPVLRPILDPLIRSVFRRDIKARLLALKHFVEKSS
jgi:ribosome-associated toxin RatA of RatAB toxin-antitoxin module